MLQILKTALAKLKPNTLTDRVFVEPTSRDRLGIVTRELTPEYVANALLKAERGDMTDLQEVYLKMYATDAHYRGCVKSVQAALSVYPVRVVVSRSKTPLAYEAAKMIERNIGMLNMRRLIRSMALVHVNGLRMYQNEYSVMQGADGKPFIALVAKKLIPPTRYMMDMEQDSPTRGELKIKTEDKPEGVLVSSYPVGSITCIDDGEEDGFYDLGGAARTCLFWYLGKNFNSKWWAEFNELYGEPLRVGYIDDNADKQTKDEMRKFLRQLSRAAWAMLPSSAEVEFIDQQKSGTIKTHQDFIGVANNEISKAVVGQIGTMGRDKYGSYGEAGVLNSVRFEIVASVASMIEDGFRDDVRFLCRMNLDLNFPEVDLPQVRIFVPNPEDRLLKMNLINGSRTFLQIPVQWARDELGIPEPDDDDEILPGFGQEQAVGGEIGKKTTESADKAEDAPEDDSESERDDAE